MTRVGLVRRTKQPGTAYARGRGFEYRIRDDLERRGFYVVRAAGSRGKCDLLAIARGHQSLLIQCKLGGRCSDEERQALQLLEVKTGAKALLVNGTRDGFEFVSAFDGTPWNGVALPAAGEA